MNNPLVSIIIPSKNSERTLERCLVSVKDQSYANIELIVIDNNSTDNTLAIANKYADKVFTKSPERSAQRNFGVKNSGGKYLLIHDSDIYFHKDSVGECVGLMEKEKCDAIILPERSIGTSFWARVREFEREFYIGNDYIEAIRFFDRQAFEEMNGYDERLTGPEDWDLTIRFRKAGKKICRVKNILEHDEGNLSLAQTVKKKKYYSNDVFTKYAKMHPRYFDKQKSFFTRFPLRSVFARGLRHPFLFFSMCCMKGAEYLSCRVGNINISKNNEIINKFKINNNYMDQKKLPKVSFIIPTYNEEKNIKDCLDNLINQNYPKENIEILVIDGGSTDSTLKIVKGYNCIILNNQKKLAPMGKALGLHKATGDLVYFHEADVRFSSSQWLKEMVKPFLESDDIFGVECDWGIADDFNSFNTYCTLLKISDPLARMLSRRKPRKIYKKNDYIIEKYDKNDNPIMYCFLWKKEIIFKVGGWENEFAEANFFSRIISNGFTKFAHQYNVTAFHYYADSFGYFVKKRKKIAMQFLNRKEIQTSWSEKNSSLYLIFCAIYLVSFIGPSIEALINFFKTRRVAWLWHPLASFVTVIIYTYYYIVQFVKK